MINCDLDCFSNVIKFKKSIYTNVKMTLAVKPSKNVYNVSVGFFKEP